MVSGVNADETKAIGSAQVRPGLATGVLTSSPGSAASFSFIVVFPLAFRLADAAPGARRRGLVSSHAGGRAALAAGEGSEITWISGLSQYRRGIKPGEWHLS